MRSFSRFFVSVVLATVAGCSTTSQPQHSAPPGGNVPVEQPASGMPPATLNDANPQRSIAEGGPKADGQTVIGRIAAVTQGGIEVNGMNGQLTSMTVDPDTRVTVDGVPAQLGDLQRGYDVRAHYTTVGGSHVASLVEAMRHASTSTGYGSGSSSPEQSGGAASQGSGSR